MPKICNEPECDWNVFGKGYCKKHQYLRTDKKPSRIRPRSEKAILQRALRPETEFDLFVRIFYERGPFSELTGKRIPYKPGDTLFVNCFLHCVNKGRSPSLRMDPRNILIGLPEEHDRQDEYPVFTERKEEMLRTLYD
jgi:hypothetical protein